jgi:hypothetical protein
MLCLPSVVRAGVVSPVSEYREKMLSLGRVKGLGGPQGIKANVLVPAGSVRNGVLVERSLVTFTTAEGRPASTPVYAQVWR